MPAIPRCHSQPNLSEQTNLLHNIALIGKESRKEIPPGLKKRFEGTGQLECDGRPVTAQITGKLNVITTAGHFFFDDNCQPRNFRSCVFTVNVGGKVQNRKIDSKSLKTGACSNQDKTTDWAVVKLDETINGVSPYEIPDGDNILKDQDDIMQVSQFHENLLVNGRYPRTMEHCKIRRIKTVDTNVPIKHDCDTGRGSSGSAQFIVRDKKMIFAAMNVGEVIQLREGQEYDNDNLFNFSVPVSGAFLQSIRTAMAP